MSYIFDLISINRLNILEAGGKGSSLGELINSGVKVPGGFVISSSAFNYFIDYNRLNNEIDKISSLFCSDIEYVHNISEKITQSIIKSEIPKDLESEVLRYFNSYKFNRVAVRSSATSEDGVSDAWAGQLESFLNVDKEHVIESVKKCWISLYSPRSIQYQINKKLLGQNKSMAVIVQEMIFPEISGVAFSVHPVTEDRNKIIIEAVYGLGEALVSGKLSPDSFIVDKISMSIIETNLASKSKGLFLDSSDTISWQDLESSKVNSPSLTNAMIIRLSNIVIEIENFYKYPCDIEWCFKGGEFYILQCRPITTLH